MDAAAAREPFPWGRFCPQEAALEGPHFSLSFEKVLRPRARKVLGVVTCLCFVALLGSSWQPTPRAPAFESRQLSEVKAVGANANVSAVEKPFQQGPPRVEAACGVVVGAWEAGGVAAFRGIPYGAPPIARRRWQPAEPAACWERGEALNASSDGPICYQMGNAGSGGGQQSEDCLNLNVFAPAAVLKDRRGPPVPVLVWIYGGSNVVGSVRSYGHIESIVHKHDHILVAVNYRLGMFGFLALSELAEVDPRGISGNAGITDQQLAMHWVQQNIGAFGGDASRVTIFGHSSGGTDVLAHLASGSSHGLFHRAIALSASGNLTMDRSTKEQQDRQFVLPRTPCANASGPPLLECLFNTDASVLNKAMPYSYGAFTALYDYTTDRLGMAARVHALPYVDGVTITMPLLQALETGLNDVPLLLQGMQAETALLPVRALENLTDRGLGEYLLRVFGTTYGDEMAADVHKRYRHFVPPAYAVYAVDSDTAVNCALRKLAQAAGRGFRSPVYWSTVVASPSGPAPKSGARFPYHGWGIVAATGAWGAYAPSDADRRFGRRLLADWSELAARGSLAGGGWRPAQSSVPGGVVGSVVGKSETRWADNHKGAECAFWEGVGVDQRWWWIN